MINQEQEYLETVKRVYRLFRAHEELTQASQEIMQEIEELSQKMQDIDHNVSKLEKCLLLGFNRGDGHD